MLDLAPLIQNKSAPSQCIPTNIEPHVPQIKGIRAVIFDIYGTLFTSEAGELNTNSPNQKNEYILESLQEVLQDITPVQHTSLSCEFITTIQTTHAEAIKNGIPYPEVNIQDIWQHILSPHYPEITPEQIATIAVLYETLTNPVWPMPGTLEVLEDLRSSNFTLGIVSNAQFYTPLLFEAFLGKPLSSLEFRSEYCIYSYLEKLAKPDKQLFLKLLQRLSHQGISPHETLYVGNDMKNDVAPAREAGMHTVLFAGDQRSLRTRPEMNLAAPSAIISHLSQIKEIVT